MQENNPFRKGAELPLQLAKNKREGAPFIDVIYERSGGRSNGVRTLGVIQEWGLLTNELGREPSVDEYADRFGFSVPTANRDLRSFRDAFPTERTPLRVLALLFDGNQTRPGEMMGIRVCEI